MKLLTDNPHFRALCRDGSEWNLPLTEYDSFKDAWNKGKAFWEGKNIFGAQVEIKLADIVGTVRETEESIQLLNAARAEEARRRKMDDILGHDDQ